MCSAHTNKSIKQSPFYQTVAYLIIIYLKVSHGLCDLSYPTSEVVLDLKDIALFKERISRIQRASSIVVKSSKRDSKKACASLFLLSLPCCRSAITSALWSGHP